MWAPLQKQRLSQFADLFGRVARREPRLSKKKLAAQLRFAKLHRSEQQDFGHNVLRTDETKVEIFAVFGGNLNTACQRKRLIPTVKHGSGGGSDSGLFYSRWKSAQWCSTVNQYFKLLQPKVVLQAFKTWAGLNLSHTVSLIYDLNVYSS